MSFSGYDKFTIYLARLISKNNERFICSPLNHIDAELCYGPQLQISHNEMNEMLACLMLFIFDIFTGTRCRNRDSFTRTMRMDRGNSFILQSVGQDTDAPTISAGLQARATESARYWRMYRSVQRPTLSPGKCSNYYHLSS